jgi:hypothetical protein
MSQTTVALDKSTKGRLCALNLGSVTYDEVLNGTLDHVNQGASGEVVVD